MIIFQHERNGTRFSITRDKRGMYVVDYVCIAHPELNDIETFEDAASARQQVNDRLDEDFDWASYL